MCKPNFFIIGAPKAGTTTLYRWLDQHPDVFMPRIKEPNYFAGDLPVEDRVSDLQEYMDLFKTAGQAAAIGEASVRYLRSEVSAGQIHALNKDSRIVCIFRQPVDAMYSMFHYALRRGRESLSDFQKALELGPEREQSRARDDIPTAPMNLCYRDGIGYAEGLKCYHDYFGKDRVLVLFFEDLKNDPETTWRQLTIFFAHRYRFHTEHGRLQHL